jgi:hypothetical protein
MRTHNEILDQRKGNDGRYYQLVRTDLGYSIVSEGYSHKYGGWVRLFEIETADFAEAKEEFKGYTA